MLRIRSKFDNINRGIDSLMKIRGFKVNADKSKVKVVGEESLQRQIVLVGDELKQVFEFNYLGYL